MAMSFFEKRFEEVSEEFLTYQAIYSDDRRTTPSNIRILKKYLGPLLLLQIGQREIEAMIAARLREGTGRATINRQRATLSRFFTWAIERGYHPGPNPLKQVRRFRESPGRTRYLTSAEADRLILAASEHLKPILRAALHTGGRLSEVLALRWKDVELERGLVVFRKETTKSRKERIVPLSPELTSRLREIRRRAPEEHVFGFRGEAIRSVRTAFSRARKKAELPGLHFHDLRHTFASWYVQNGGDPYRLQKYLGHSTMALTQRYAHLSPDFVADGARYIGPPALRSPKRESEKQQD